MDFGASFNALRRVGGGIDRVPERSGPLCAMTSRMPAMLSCGETGASMRPVSVRHVGSRTGKTEVS